jgi:hypothetical protein
MGKVVKTKDGKVSFYVAIGDVKNRNDKVEKNQSQASVL